MATRQKKVFNEQVLRMKQESAARALKLFDHAIVNSTFVRTNAVPAVVDQLPTYRHG